MPSSQKKPFDFFHTMPRYFWLLFIVFGITSGVLLVDRFRTSYSQVTVLVIHKNEKTAASADQVVDNIAEIPKMLSFYDRLLRRFPEIRDPWTGMSDDARQEAWADHIMVDRVDYSGLIRLEINADTASDASSLAEKVSTNLFETIGRYYDIRNEIDIRTVDGPTMRTQLRAPFGWFLSSVVSGFVLAMAVSGGIASIAVAVGRLRERRGADRSPKLALEKVSFPLDGGENAPKPSGSSLYQEHRFVQQMTSLSGKSAMAQPPVEPVKDELDPFVDTEIKSAPEKSVLVAPRNLPFLEEGVSLEEHLFGSGQSVPSEPATEVSDVSDAPVEAAKEDVVAEPTEDELKRRLNQLLRGEM